MKDVPNTDLAVALRWCEQKLGAAETLSDHSKEHGGHESSTRRLRTATGTCYLKIHTSRSHWASEVHGYENWSKAFGDRAPTLLAVREEEPLALVVSEIPGRVLEGAGLDAEQERSVWRSAGSALLALHELRTGSSFGIVHRDGTPLQAQRDAIACVSERFSAQIEQASRAGYLSDLEQKTAQRAFDLIPCFAGEAPVPCHRDYCAANWLVDDSGEWAGVIDFEFSHWDVRVADFSRDPNWNWMTRPDLVDAFFDGYGTAPSGEQKLQLHVAYAEYAVGAILWGHNNAFYGFEQEGRDALVRLESMLAG